MRFGIVGLGRMGSALSRQALDAGHEMVCHSPIVAEVEALAAAGAADVVIDGGNSFWTEAERHHTRLAARGIQFFDVGTSGRISGAGHGARRWSRSRSSCGRCTATSTANRPPRWRPRWR